MFSLQKCRLYLYFFMVVARLILVFLNTLVEKLIFFSMISTEAKISLNRLFLSFSKPGITSYVAN